MTTSAARDFASSSSSGLALSNAQVIAAVPEWWRLRAEAIGLSGRWTDVRQALAAQPPTDIPEIDHIAAVSDLGTAYVETLDSRSRALHGQHYTPDDLSNRLWEMARSSLGFVRGVDTMLPGLVRDPACGAGALLVPALREHLRAAAEADVDPALILRSLPARIEGIDQDPWSAWLTNVVLGAELLRVLTRVPEALRSPIPVLARQGDGLADNQVKALVSLQNPPYGRQKLSSEQRARYDHVLYGHANLYAMFMAAGAADLEDGGVLAALVPTSFTAGRYFHRLRGHLASELPLHAVTFVHSRSGVFAGVLQETCMATFRRHSGRRIPVSRSNGQISAVAKVPTPTGDEPWLLPREAADAAVAAAASKMPLTLAGAGWHASTGPLVWNRRRSDLHSRPAPGRATVLWAADIADGVVGRSPLRSALRYLTLSTASDETVMVLQEPAILVQRTTSPEQTRRLVSADLSPEVLKGLGGRVVVENHVNVLRPTTPEPLLSRETLARVLGTPTMDRLVRCISGSVGLSSYELASLPLPGPKILATWNQLDEIDLEKAVADAYSAKIRT